MICIVQSRVTSLGQTSKPVCEESVELICMSGPILLSLDKVRNGFSGTRTVDASEAYMLFAWFALIT